MNNLASMNDNSNTAEAPKRSLVPHILNDAIRVARFSERAEVGRALAYAFAEEELSFFILDGDDGEMSTCPDEHRWDVHYNIMRYVSALYIVGGTVTVAGPDYDTVALWYVSKVPYQVIDRL